MPRRTDVDLKHCPHCKHKLSPAFLISAGASARSQKRDPSTYKGRPKILNACEFCRQKFGVAEMRKHIPLCPRRNIRRAA